MVGMARKIEYAEICLIFNETFPEIFKLIVWTVALDASILWRWVSGCTKVRYYLSTIQRAPAEPNIFANLACMVAKAESQG